MPDRENVIERLEKVSYYFKSLLAVGWQGDADIYREHQESVNMAIALLREQEAITPIKQIEQNEWTVCGNCRNHLISKWRFCPYCGKAVKWE